MAAVDADKAPLVPRRKPAESSGDDRCGAATRPVARPTRSADLLAVSAGFLVVAMFLTTRLWANIPGRALGANRHDQAFFEWMLAHGARAVSHLENPLLTDRMNVPDGVNLMANTSILGLSVPLSPITLLFGAHASFVVLLTLAFASTGTAWYYVLSRHAVTSRVAALVGAGFCAFAPGMVSHGNGHPNIVAQFLVPFIILATLRLRGQISAIRHGLVLGLLVVWQAFINEEVLLLTALGLGIFAVVAVVRDRQYRQDVKPALAGLGVAAVVAGSLLAYPLWVQFAGPGSYHGLRDDIKQYGADLASYPAFSTESLAGLLSGASATARGLAQNATEENAFFGFPLLILVAVLAIWLRRSTIAVALNVVIAAFALMSFGGKLRWHGDPLVRGPWDALQRLPLFDSIVPTRFALAIVPALGVLLALAWDRWRREYAGAPGWMRYTLPIAFALALVPLLPTPLPDRPYQPAPAVLTDGGLDPFIGPDRSVVFVPPARSQYPEPLYWAAQANLNFRMAHGYFLGPVADPARPQARYAIFTAPARPTTTLLNQVSESGVVPDVTEAMRRAAADDLRYWRAGALVLVPDRNAEPLRRVTTQLVGGEPVERDGVWIWDVRGITG